MKVIKAQTAGFCFGVKRAVDQVYDLAAKEKEPVYTYGPIISSALSVAFSIAVLLAPSSDA